MRIADELAARLEPDQMAALDRLLSKLSELLPLLHREALLDYQESRGDDAALYGLRVYKHLRFALMSFVERDPLIAFVDIKGAYSLAVGPLQIRVDSLGHYAHEDVRTCFPDSSPSKLDVGRSNFFQLQFDLPEAEPVPDASAYTLNRLTAGHFGNPREGLVKWYLGAWTETPNGGKIWAWIERQDDRLGEQPAPLSPKGPIVPFSERAADAVAVRPRGA